MSAKPEALIRKAIKSLVRLLDSMTPEERERFSGLDGVIVDLEDAL